MKKREEYPTVVWEFSPASDYREILRKAFKIIMNDDPQVHDIRPLFDENSFLEHHEAKAGTSTRRE